MFSKDPIRIAAALVALLLSVLGLAWSGGARTASLEEGVRGLTQFRTEQRVINTEQAEKLTRVETMVEMVVRNMGLNPPPRKRGR